MRPERAIRILEELKAHADSPEILRPGQDFTAWRLKTRAVVAGALPHDTNLVEQLDKQRYTLGRVSIYTTSDEHRQAHINGIKSTCGIIEAAIFQLQCRVEDEDEPIDHHSFDPDLWAHVRDLVDAEDWKKVASQTSIFVESTIRKWAGEPRGKNGEVLVGKGLMATVFGDISELRCGRQAGEWEGWRALATGFMQALSNVDRHHINEREDARRYAIGVLGLGSLLLTQLQHQHFDLIAERLAETASPYDHDDDALPHPSDPSYTQL